MDDLIERLKEGDVYRWSYREPGDDRGWGRYHCRSRIGIFHNGRLRDTYWQIGGSFPHAALSFGADDLPKLDLVYEGNLEGLEKAEEYQADYYDDADIVNLNHPNSTQGNFYLRKEAKRSAKKMLEVARRKLERSESDERSAARRSGELREAISRIDAGSTDVHLF